MKLCDACAILVVCLFRTGLCSRRTVTDRGTCSPERPIGLCKREYCMAEVPVPLRPSGYAAEVLLAALTIVRHFTSVLHSRTITNPIIAGDTSIRTSHHDARLPNGKRFACSFCSSTGSPRYDFVLSWCAHTNQWKTTPDERTELPGTRTKMLASNRAVSNDAPCFSCTSASES